jgi:hypothetical protein
MAAPTYEEFTEAKSGANVTSITIDKPANTAEGDLLICGIATDGDNSASSPGWTEISQNSQSTSAYFGCFYKIAGASEPSSYTFDLTSSEQVYAFILRITGHDSSNPIDVDGAATGTTIGAIVPCPAVTTLTDDCLILRMWGIDDDDIFVDGGYPYGHTGITCDKSASLAGTCAGQASYKTQATAGDTGTANCDITADEEYVAVTVAIKPSSGAATYYETLAATATGVTALSTLSTFYKALAVIASASAVLTTLGNYYRSLTVVATGTAGLTRRLYQALAATATGVASLAKAKMFTQTLAVVAVGSSVLSKVPTYVKTLAVTTSAVVGLARLTSLYRTLAVVAQTSPSLAKKMFESLSAVATASAVVSKAKLFGKTLAVTASAVASLVAEQVEGATQQALSAVATAVARLKFRINRVLSIDAQHTLQQDLNITYATKKSLAVTRSIKKALKMTSELKEH